MYRCLQPCAGSKKEGEFKVIIRPTPLHKAVLIEMEPIQDNRGYFARSFCKKTLLEYGIAFDMVQCNVTMNHHPYTLRGMHFQIPPFCEDKIISCFNGAIYDVIIDLNRQSPTFGKWFGQTLSVQDTLSLYVPKGFAHGYQTLTENAGISYMVSEYYTPSHESGVRWNDSAFGIEWPHRNGIIISAKDEHWKDFNKKADGIIQNEGNSYGQG